MNGAALRAWRSYAGASPGTRAFLAARLAIIPLRGLDADLRALRGRVLSLGSGHGILERYLAEINDKVEVEGFELDAERVTTAAASQERAPRVVLHHRDVRDLGAPGSFDAALLVDVLHHIPAAEQGGVLSSVAGCLRPGGTCLIKDIATTPRWQHRWNALHDRLVAGDATWCRDPADMLALAAANGLEGISQRRLGRAGPYPHYLLTARRP